MSTNEKQLNKKIKNQRLAICVLVFLIPLLGWFFNSNFYIIGMNKSSFPMLDPLREFTPAENYITNITELRKYLATLGDKYPESITIYYENINSGANISINKDLRLFPASLSKLVQAILIVSKVEKGQMSFDQKLKAVPEDLSSGSGDLYRVMSDGRSITVEELLKELLVNSDNTAQNIFKHHLDFSDYEKFQNSTGLQDLYNQNGFISSKEYTRILRVLYTSNFLEPKNSSKILEYMAQSSFHDYLSAGMPGDVKFAHKYGENKDYSIFADSGIVYIPGKPYMISVIIKGKDSSDESKAWAAGLMKEISEQVYLASK